MYVYNLYYVGAAAAAASPLTSELEDIKSPSSVRTSLTDERTFFSREVQVQNALHVSFPVWSLNLLLEEL